jgi:hypothetical protein
MEFKDSRVSIPVLTALTDLMVFRDSRVLTLASMESKDLVVFKA